MDKKFQKSFMKCFMGTAGDFFLAGSQKDRHRGTSGAEEGFNSIGRVSKL